MSIKVAVYGSLRQGHGNHKLMIFSESLGTHTFTDNFVMISLGGFPGIIPSRDKHDIVVEVYNIDNDTLLALDQLEGEPNFYKRQQITGQGEELEGAWIYILQRNYQEEGGQECVTSGDWSRYRGFE